MCFSCRENETVVRIRHPVDGSVVVIVVTLAPQEETSNPTENDGKVTRYFMLAIFYKQVLYRHIQALLDVDLSLIQTPLKYRHLSNTDTSLIQTPL